jgi:Na+:H+ antiporter, NhaA family
MEHMIPLAASTVRSTTRRTTCSASTDAEITLVEYGSYACSHCRAANERIAQIRQFCALPR